MRMDTIPFGRLADLFGPRDTGGNPAVVVNKTSLTRAALIRTAVLVLADLLSFCLALMVTDFVTFAGEIGGTRDPNHGRLGVVLGAQCLGALLAGVIMAAKGQYTQRSSFWCEAQRLTGATSLAALVVLFWPFEHEDMLVRLVAAGVWLLVPVWTIAMRKKLRQALARAGLWRLPVVVLASPDAMDRVAQMLNSQRPFDFDIVKTITFDCADPVVTRDWGSFLEQHRACRLIAAVSPGVAEHDRVLDTIVRSHIPFTVVLENGALPVYGGHDTRMLRSDSVLVSYQNGLSRPVIRTIKIAMDLCLTGILLLVCAPLMICLAGLIMMDGGPVFFAHERIGKKGRQFRCLKFRTMAVDGDSILARTLAQDPAAQAEWNATRKLRKDPRVTRVGRFLRSTSLDELPQFFNVLRLEMSLVGPRPIVYDEISRYAEDIVFYHETRPGLTGLWQVSGRSNTSYEQRVAYDRWYVKNWTLWHDIVILGLTLPAVVARSGAR